MQRALQKLSNAFLADHGFATAHELELSLASSFGAVLVAAALVAYAMPAFALVVGLVGAVAVCTLSFALPPLVHLLLEGTASSIRVTLQCLINVFSAYCDSGLGLQSEPISDGERP